MGGYWNDPAATAEILRDGWCYTGDLARADAHGVYTIVDRRKEMIISGGYNVYPREVEDVLYRHPAVAECAVIGAPDATWGEVVHALIVAKPGCAIAEEAIRAHCAARARRLQEAPRNHRSRRAAEDRQWQDRQEGAARHEAMPWASRSHV